MVGGVEGRNGTAKGTQVGGEEEGKEEGEVKVAIEE